MPAVTAATEAATPAPPSTAPPHEHRRTTLVIAVAIGLAIVASIVLRFVATSHLWLDEALSVNIARLPLSDLPDALRHDGAPPLYYVLLHFWMRAFGEGDTAVRSLSAVFSIATYPAMYFAGRRLAGRFGGWAALLVFASSPFAFRYATEARMYSLVMFLVAWGYLATLRALERPSIGRCALVTLVVAGLLYSHNWSYYLLATVGGVLLLRAWRGSTAAARRGAWLVIAAMGVGALCYVPWLPVVKYQLAHTGTPWGDPQLPWSGFPGFVRQFAGIGQAGQPGLSTYYYYYAALAIVLPLLALFGAAVDDFHIDLDLRTRPLVRWEAVVGVGSILVGLVLSYLAGTAFDGRYASIGAPLILLCIAMGVTVFANPTWRVGVLVLLVLLGFVGGVRNARAQRTQAAEVASVIRARAEPGDVVVYCPDQLGPAVHRVLGDDLGLKEVTFPSLRPPAQVDWVDYRERIDATSSADFVDRVTDLADGARIWYVVTTGYRSFEGRCEQVHNRLQSHRGTPKVRVVGDGTKFFEPVGLEEFSPG